ncbi:hypothetical protein AN958_09701 [Leucoagaricus sp. SymC.cos]|nr:hypothetical protein AN958_09701 [Leucoagaricus sp. SymC.cos]
MPGLSLSKSPARGIIDLSERQFRNSRTYKAVEELAMISFYEQGHRRAREGNFRKGRVVTNK